VELDDPNKPEFSTWDSYSKFARRVRHEYRYILSEKDHAFLATVRATCRNRDYTFKEGRVFVRAALGIDWHDFKDEEGNNQGEEPVGYGAERMNPLPFKAIEGRANSKGIPVLYLANTKQSAISEVRPWIGSEVSVAQFKLVRPLKALDLTRGHGRSATTEVMLESLVDDPQPPMSAEKKEELVWVEIDNAFSRPVTVTDNTADYVPTQILAEHFRSMGYEALIYRSKFGEKGYNVVLFNPADAETINCAPYDVTDIEVKFSQSGNRWHKREEKKD